MSTRSHELFSECTVSVLHNKIHHIPHLRMLLGITLANYFGSCAWSAARAVDGLCMSSDMAMFHMSGNMLVSQMHVLLLGKCHIFSHT